MSTIRTVEHRDVDSVIRSVTRNRGKYAFLIGAGTSYSADIPLAGEFIDQWQNKLYIEEMLGLEIECDEPDRKQYEDRIDDDAPDFHEWINDYRSQNMEGHQNEYGFWFSECYPTREERRRHIHDHVKDVDVTFGHIMMAGMLNANPPYISHVLTPNFDDLLYNAFYEYFNERPRMLNHNAIIGPEFKLTKSDPAIIKLHGDYLYSNLQNTGSETSTLEKNMQTALRRTIQEYGLVVIGYSGRDDSIMDVLTSEEFSIPEPGIFWCAYDANNLSQNVQKLLRKPNTYLVEIDGFQDLMGDFYRKVRHDEGFLFPRAKEIEDRMRKLSNKVVAEVEDFRVTTNEDSDGGTDTEDNGDVLKGLRNRLAGDYWREEGRDEYAEDCYKRAIMADPEDPMNYIALAGYYAHKTESSASDDETDPAETGETESTLTTFEQWVLAEDLYTVAMAGPCQETTPTADLGTVELDVNSTTNDGDEIVDLNELDLDGLDRMEIYNGRGTVRRRIARLLGDLADDLRPEDKEELSDDNGEPVWETVRKAAEEKWEEALRDFKWAVDRNPDAHRPYVSKGIACFRRAQFYHEIAESKEEIEEQQSIDEIAESKAAIEQHRMALSCYERATDRSTAEEIPHLSLAEVAFRLKKFETTAEEAQKAADLSRELDGLALSKYFQLLGKIALRESSELTTEEENELEDEIDKLRDDVEDLSEKEYDIEWVKEDIRAVIDAVKQSSPVTESIEDGFIALIPADDETTELVDGFANCVQEHFDDTDVDIEIKQGFLAMTDTEDDVIADHELTILHEGVDTELRERLKWFCTAADADAGVIDGNPEILFTGQDISAEEQTNKDCNCNCNGESGTDDSDGDEMQTEECHLIYSAAETDERFETLANDDYILFLSGEEPDDDDLEVGIKFGDDDEEESDVIDELLKDLFEDEVTRPKVTDNIEEIAQYVPHEDVEVDPLKETLNLERRVSTRLLVPAPCG